MNISASFYRRPNKSGHVFGFCTPSTFSEIKVDFFYLDVLCIYPLRGGVEAVFNRISFNISLVFC